MPHLIPLRPDEPRRIGRYRLTGRVYDPGAAQAGSRGTYQATRTDGEPVTVTLLGADRAADAAARDRFTAEARAARRVPPFCAARILDAGFEAARPYLVTEHVPGPTLEEAVAAGGPLREEAVRGLAAGAATGLAAIHQAGLVHGQLGPKTIVLGPGGPRLVHFSITPPYGAATPAADILAWAGSVLFGAIGRPPRARADPASDRPGSMGYGPRDVAALPEDLRDIIGDCLNPDPAARPPARVVLTALLGQRDMPAGLLAEGSRLAQAAARPTVSMPAPPRAGPARRLGRPAVILWIAACAACLVAIVAAVSFITSRSPAPAASPTPGRPGRSPAAHVPAALAGTWAGTVHQTHPLLSVAVHISLHGSTGSVAYPALDCSGSLTVVSVAPARLVLHQTIGAGSKTCEDGLITLTPRPGGKLAFTFGRAGSSSPAGTLTRRH